MSNLFEYISEELNRQYHEHYSIYELSNLKLDEIVDIIEKILKYLPNTIFITCNTIEQRLSHFNEYFTLLRYNGLKFHINNSNIKQDLYQFLYFLLYNAENCQLRMYLSKFLKPIGHFDAGYEKNDAEEQLWQLFQKKNKNIFKKLHQNLIEKKKKKFKNEQKKILKNLKNQNEQILKKKDENFQKIYEKISKKK